MRKTAVLLCLIFSILFSAAFINRDDQLIPIPACSQRTGNAEKGYEYLTSGDFLKSGVPYGFFIMKNGVAKDNLLGRTGKNANVEEGYNVVHTSDSVDIVIPTCLQCHSQVFEGKLYVGLGNTFKDFSNISNQRVPGAGIKFMQASAPRQYNAFKAFLQSYNTVNPEIETEIRGVNPADRLAAVLVAHRDPKTLMWTDTPILNVPASVVVTDVPAWWLLKKKNAMFYTAFGRGDFSKFLMMSNLLTVSDSSEASEVDSHFGDVLAYINSLEPPKYPCPIDKKLAAEGKLIFGDNCQDCHGTYGANSTYPNLLIPGNVIQTDSLLFTANQQNNKFLDWFNNSWFAQGPNPAKPVPILSTQVAINIFLALS